MILPPCAHAQRGKVIGSVVVVVVGVGRRVLYRQCDP